MTHTPDINEQVNAAIRGMEGKMTARTGVKWELQRTPYESEIDIVSDGRVIATVEAGADKEMIAHLINAAPKMYTALQNVRVELDSYPHCPFCGSVHGEGHEKDCIGYEVEAAIKKAEGEGMDENVRSHIGSVITLDELGIDVEVMDITGEVDAVY